MKEEVQFFPYLFLHIKKGERTYQFAAGRLLGSGDEKHVLLILIDEKQLEDLYGSVQEQGGQVYLYDQMDLLSLIPIKKCWEAVY